MPFAGRCVVLPASVRSIGEAAFAECNSLVAIAVDPANAFYRTVDGVLSRFTVLAEPNLAAM